MGAAGRAIEIEDAASQQVTAQQSVDRGAQEFAQAVRASRQKIDRNLMLASPKGDAAVPRKRHGRAGIEDQAGASHRHDRDSVLPGHVKRFDHRHITLQPVPSRNSQALGRLDDGVERLPPVLIRDFPA